MMIDFLYYRIFLVVKRTSLYDIPMFASSVILGLILGLNFISIYSLARKLKIDIPHIFVHKYVGGLVIAIFILIIYFIYVVQKRSEKVIERYQDENRSRVESGRIILIFFTIVTIALLFIVGIYKPGVL